MTKEIDANSLPRVEPAGLRWSELAESVAVWMGILIIGLATAALAAPARAHSDGGPISIGIPGFPG